MSMLLVDGEDCEPVDRSTTSCTGAAAAGFLVEVDCIALESVWFRPVEDSSINCTEAAGLVLDVVDDIGVGSV